MMRELAESSLSGSPLCGHFLSMQPLIIQLSPWVSSLGNWLPRDRKQKLPGLLGPGPELVSTTFHWSKQVTGQPGIYRRRSRRKSGVSSQDWEGLLALSLQTIHHTPCSSAIFADDPPHSMFFNHLCRWSTTLHVFQRAAVGPPQHWVTQWVGGMVGVLLSPKRKELTFPTFEERIEFPS